MKLAFIVAMDENRGIGYHNQLPWHMPADLQHFKKMTLGKPIIMGRKTYESIGRPLLKRRNIIITRDPIYRVEGCEVFNTLDAALAAVSDVEEAMMIGGAELFNQLLPKADRLYLTEIHHQFEVDTFFSEINLKEWKVIDEEYHPADDANPYDYTFSTLEKQ
jgi:dihydrofolate reductase